MLLGNSPVLPSEPVRDCVYDGTKTEVREVCHPWRQWSLLMQHWLESFSLKLPKDQNPLCLWRLALHCVTFPQLPKHSSQHTLGADRIPLNFSGSFTCLPLTFSFISQMCHVSNFFSLDQRPGCCRSATGPVIISHWGPRPEEEQHFEGQLWWVSLHEKSRTASSEGRWAHCGRWVLLLWCTAPSLVIILHTLQMSRDGLRYYFSKKSLLNWNCIKVLQNHSLP